jgi:hypothetical protein
MMVIHLNDPSKLACVPSLGRAPMLVPLRPSNEHILIVRVPGAQDQCGCPSNPFLSWGLCEHKGQLRRSPASNCMRSSGTALCAIRSIGQACASGPIGLLSAIRPPFPSQSWGCRAMGCSSPQSPGGFSLRSPEGRRTYQPLNR